MTQIFSHESGAHLSRGEIKTKQTWIEKIGTIVFGLGLITLISSISLVGIKSWKLSNTLDTAHAELAEIQLEQVSSLSGSSILAIDEFDILIAIEKEKQSWGPLIRDIQTINSKGEIEIKSINGKGNTVEVELRSLNSSNYSLTSAAKFADKLKATDRITEVNIPQADKIIHAGNLAESQITLQAILN